MADESTVKREPWKRTFDAASGAVQAMTPETPLVPLFILALVAYFFAAYFAPDQTKVHENLFYVCTSLLGGILLNVKPR